MLACAPTQQAHSGDTASDAAVPEPQSESTRLPTPEIPMPEGKNVSFRSELERVSKIRALPIKGEPVGLLVEPEELLRHVKKTVSLETPEHALSGTEKMLVALGVVPLSFDYKATMLSLLSSSLQGLYDPRLKAMLVRSDLKENRKPTLLHELVHALQDQSYDLTEIVEWNPDDTDVSSALSSFAEGDATSAMFDAMLPEGQTALDLPPGFIEEQFGHVAPGDDSSDVPPRAIRKSLIAPYIDGIGFVHALRKRGGWSEVNRVWKRPPTTTEQILHVEKYDAGEAAIPVEVPGKPPGQWRLLLSDTWGEQSLRLILEEGGKKKEAHAAAAGWGGDRIALYEKGDEIALAWELVMDSSTDAEELALFFLSRDKQAARPKAASERALCQMGTSPPLAVSLSGTSVLVTSGHLNRVGGSVGNCSQAQGWNMTLRGKSTTNGN